MNPSPSFFVNCSYCGGKVRKFPSSVRHSKSGKLFCNKSCKSKFQNMANLEKQIECFCHNCGKEMRRSLSGFTKNAKLSGKVFCSRKCDGIFKRQLTGEKSPGWRGGCRKDERTLIRGRKFWKELREEILSLFQGTCTICKQEHPSLHLHHSLPWRLGGKDVKENLLPLCPKCHSKQTVKDWENEHGLDWKTFGAHMSHMPMEAKPS